MFKRTLFSTLAISIAGMSALSAAAADPSSDQKVYEDFELNGGSFNLAVNIPFGGGKLVTGTNFIVSMGSGGLTQSPLIAGATIQTPLIASLDAALAIPDLGTTRILLNGQFQLLPLTAPHRISYAGSAIQIDYLAADGSTVLTTSKRSAYNENPLTGTMGNSPEELLAGYPIDDWVKFNNFAGTAKWLPGSAYLKFQSQRAIDTVFAQDCANAEKPSPDSSAEPAPCASGTPLENIFPVNFGSPGHVSETDFAADGVISTVQGVKMWVAKAPMALQQDYRVFFELNGNIYMGAFEKGGTVLVNEQSDGSAVGYFVTLNAAAVDSVQQGIITGATVPGSSAGSTAEVQTLDLFGIGGHAINGSLGSADLRAHYNVPADLTGAGQTVAIVDAPGTGDILDNLNVYSQANGLPQCNSSNPCFEQIDQSNGATGPNSSASSDDWGPEVALDTQMIHAIAPAAKIVLVTAASDQPADVIKAINTAAAIPGVTAVSMSFSGYPLQTQEEAKLGSFQAKNGVIFLGSSGDGGFFGDAGFPTSSEYVTTVGGTAIRSVQWNGPLSETAWIYSGGGISSTVPMPSWQSAYLAPAYAQANMGVRAIPDVAAVADFQHSAVAVYYDDSWMMSGGTSASSPIWAGISAVFAEYLRGKGASLASLVESTSGGFNGLVYGLKKTHGATSGFHDIVSGSNNLTGQDCPVCDAVAGYNDVTGIGSPDVTAILANF